MPIRTTVRRTHFACQCRFELQFACMSVRTLHVRSTSHVDSNFARRFKPDVGSNFTSVRTSHVGPNFACRFEVQTSQVGSNFIDSLRISHVGLNWFEFCHTPRAIFTDPCGEALVLISIRLLLFFNRHGSRNVDR